VLYDSPTEQKEKCGKPLICFGFGHQLYNTRLNAKNHPKVVFGWLSDLAGPDSTRAAISE
jgi:hypothetical protein